MQVRESTIEQELIEKLSELKYTLRPDIRDRAAMERNFREKFQALNRVKLTDAEFQRLLEEVVTPDVFKAAHTLRHRNAFTRDDGTPLNYTLVNINDWCKNDFEVASQFRINTDYSYHRYDVLLLINGVPAVQIELKTLGINPRRAIEQIVEYKNDPGNSYTRTLLCFIQLFIVSNRDFTYYFANNNARHFAFNADERFLPIYQYAASDNTKINGIDAFAEAFLAKCTLGQMISRYMVLVASEQKLLMMRPYQIYAVKNIVECIEKNLGNGYIWHTTGSGKTLTSFKASTLLKANPAIEKCLFVVDRKDLDRQTREEFNRFQEGCVEENTNTGALVRRMLSDDAADKVIVCTIQKLGLALDENSKRNKSREKRGLASYTDQLESLRDKRIVFIFDECHRSQFGDNHQAIKEFFPKAQLFGFTGTPIFEQNASYKRIEGDVQTLKTTEDLFQQSLHEYTITHAIEDRNVLRFHVDYYKPDGKHALKAGETLAKRAVVEAILAKHDAATGGRRFNAILATASINDAIEYYKLFEVAQAEKQQANPDFVPLNIAAVFSPPADVSADVKQLQEDLPQEQEDNKQDPEAKKNALKAIIADYNARFGTNHRIEEFDAYYQDVQQRIKDQQFPNADLPMKGREKLDIVIVVDMLLTGFDSKYLIGQFAAGSGKKAGEFYTPQQISNILSAIVTLDSQEPKAGPRRKLDSVFDFACGSGSLLLNVRHRMTEAGGSIGRIYGQESNITTYNLARMNMLLHGVKDTEFEIWHGDTLKNDWDWLRETNPAKKPKFDAVVANPPFSYRWEPKDEASQDSRFKNHGVAPKSAADFAFLLHGLHYLKDDGVMAIILPHGVLFRGGKEAEIRTKLLTDSHIDTVIGLPPNLFYSTGIPVCILVLKKCKKPDDVLFINAADHFVKGKRQNQLTDEHIQKIVSTYQNRNEQERYSRRVAMKEIVDNDYNLNISRYISTAEAEKEIDLKTVHADLEAIELSIDEAKKRHNVFLVELGLPPLP